MADRNNPAFDMAVDSNGITSMIRVKTTRSKPNGDLQWGVKRSGEVFIDLRRKRDFVALVDLRDGVRAAVVYIVPTDVVDEALRRVQREYVSHPKRDGGDRKADRHILRLDGKDKPDNPSFEFARKWQQYREAWHLLETSPGD